MNRLFLVSRTHNLRNKRFSKDVQINLSTALRHNIEYLGMKYTIRVYK